MNRESGFTLAEVLIAGAIIVMVAMVGLSSAVLAAHALTWSGNSASDSGIDSIERFATNLRAESQASFAVYAPSAGTPGGGSIVYFYGKNQQGSDEYWAYEARGNVVQREDFGPNLNQTPTVTTVDGVTSLSVRLLEAPDLVNPAKNPNYASVMQGMAVPQQYDVPMVAAGGLLPQAATAKNFSGGNHVVEVTLGNAAGEQTLHLMGGAMPSGFTLVGTPSFHVVVYANDNEVCSPLGCWLWHDVHRQINGRVSVSYNGGTTWKPWCDIGIYSFYGGNGGAFVGSDARLNYNPNDPLEKADYSMAQCAKSNVPMPGITPSPKPTPPKLWSRWPSLPTPVPAPLPPNVPAPVSPQLPPDYCQANPGATVCAPPAPAPSG